MFKAMQSGGHPRTARKKIGAGKTRERKKQKSKGGRSGHEEEKRRKIVKDKRARGKGQERHRGSRNIWADEKQAKVSKSQRKRSTRRKVGKDQTNKMERTNGEQTNTAHCYRLRKNRGIIQNQQHGKNIRETYNGKRTKEHESTIGGELRA